MVGAPRAQSSWAGQRKINESGAIYQCSFNVSSCEVFEIDRSGNQKAENNSFELNSEFKDEQWLGATMDGSSDGKQFVVSIKILLKICRC